MKEPELTLRPSQWINTGWIMFGLLGIPLVIPPLIAIYKIIDVYCHKYHLYDEYMLETKGVFNRTTSELYYYRIKSIQLDEPLLYRILDLYTVRIISSDKYLPNLNLTAIPVGPIFVQEMRDIIKVERKRRGVRELDV
jgi:hypothetical protein